MRRDGFPRGGRLLPRACNPEPLISCGLAGSAQFHEREVGEAWLTRQIGPGHIFVTSSKTPDQVRFSSPVGEELEIVQVHIAVDQNSQSRQLPISPNRSGTASSVPTSAEYSCA